MAAAALWLLKGLRRWIQKDDIVETIFLVINADDEAVRRSYAADYAPTANPCGLLLRDVLKTKLLPLL